MTGITKTVRLKSTPVSVRIPDKDLERLDALGEKMRRSRSWLLQEAVKKFLNEEND